MGLCTKGSWLLLLLAHASSTQSLRSVSIGSKTSVLQAQMKNAALFDCRNDNETEAAASKFDGHAKCPRLQAYEPSSSTFILNHEGNSEALDNRPLRWLHVPKTGTTFANSVVRLACSSSSNGDEQSSTLPAYAAIRSRLPPRQDTGLMAYFSHCFPAVMCQCWGTQPAVPGGATRSKRKVSSVNAADPATYRLHRAADPHESLTNFQPAQVAHVMMLREPLQRIASAYAHHHKGVGEACTRRGHDCHPDLTLLEYVQRPEVQGLYARMLTGLPWDQPPPWTAATDSTSATAATAKEDTAAMQAAALARLEAFAFVGLVEQWDLSVCVFHAAFATRRSSFLWPHRLEFSALRPGSWSASNAVPLPVVPSLHAWNTNNNNITGAAAAKAAVTTGSSPLGYSGAVNTATAHVYHVKELKAALEAAGQFDEVDGAVYAAGVKRFEEQVAAYRDGRTVPTQFPAKLSGAAATRNSNGNPSYPPGSNAHANEAQFEFKPSMSVPRVDGGSAAGPDKAVKSLFSGGFLPWLFLSAVCCCAWVGFG